MPKIKKTKNKIEECTKIFIYRDLKWYGDNEFICTGQVNNLQLLEEVEKNVLIKIVLINYLS